MWSNIIGNEGGDNSHIKTNAMVNTILRAAGSKRQNCMGKRLCSLQEQKQEKENTSVKKKNDHGGEAADLQMSK